MAGIFKTLGSTLSAIDTVAASTSRRLSVWATETETQTRYRHVAKMVEIQNTEAQNLASALDRRKELTQNASFNAALQLLVSTEEKED